MNKPAIAACLAGLCAAPLALAQSNLTVFGVVDLAVRKVDNQGVGSASGLVSGSSSTSRFGVRGSEDLGAGLSARFHLESGFSADTGAASGGTRFWDRRATVSLAGKSIGELRLGRDFVPSYRSWSRFDPFSYVGVARSADLFSNTPAGPISAAFAKNDNTTVRADNGVQYLLPALGGLEGELMFTPGEGGDATAGKAKLFGARLGYATKVFSVSAASTTSQNSLTTAGKFKDHVVGGSYTAGPVVLSAAWRQMSYNAAKQTNLLVAAEATRGLHVLRASWQKVDLDGKVGSTAISANDASKWGLGYSYNLSKRTGLYATVARIDNDGAAKFSIPGGPAGLVAGGSSTGYEAGMIHRF